MPVEKLDKRVEGEGAAAEPEVAHIILQPDMRGVIAEKEEP